MSNMTLNGRKVVDIQIDGVDSRDYPDFCDAYFSYALFEDTMQELDEAEMDALMDKYPDVVNEMAFESLH